jgi:hypothetical protein
MQLKNVVDPFGEVNVHPGTRGTRVVATILMKPHKEGAQTGIALDGSGSMRKLYGQDDGARVLSPIFGGTRKQLSNDITPVAQKLCAYLARNIDADGGTTCIYWAVGSGGGEIEVVGDLTAEQAERHTFGPPRDFGTGTQLLPAVRYFTERFRSAPWGFYVFITDGELHDLEEVVAYSKRLAQDIASGRRNPVKFVLIGLGPDVNEYQMAELDDLETGTNVDLWDHKLAKEMRILEEIFAEVVDKNARIADNGRILDHMGRVVRDYSGSGLPAYLEFEVPTAAPYFTLEVNGHRIRQPLKEGIDANPPTPFAPAPAPVVPAAPVVSAAPPPPPAPKPAPAPTPPPAPKEEVIDHLPIDISEDEWRNLPLEFGKEEPQKTDLDLEQHND